MTVLATLMLATGAAATLATVAFPRAAARHAPTAATVGPGPVARTLSGDGYRLQLALTPNKPFIAGAMSLRLDRDGKPVNNARIRITFTMRGMDSPTRFLPETGVGLYQHRGPALSMSGNWTIRLDVAPHDAAPFSITLLDRLAS